MINLLFSMDGPRLSEAQASVFATFGQWVVLNEHGGRLLVDAVGEYNDIGNAMSTLQAMGRSPQPIGGWKKDGDALAYYPLNVTAWLDVAPDDVDDTDPDNPVLVRPTSFRDAHRWAGWSAKKTL